MTYAIYFNGVYRTVLEEILTAQATQNCLTSYLQPYSSRLIVGLANDPPSPKSPVELYLSTTDDLTFVSYKANIVGWANKSKLSPKRITEINRHFMKHQPEEGELFFKTGSDKPANNLIEISDLRRLTTPVSVSSFTKDKDGTPLKPRRTSGGWSYVRKAPAWLGSLTETVTEEQLEESLVEEIRESHELTQTQRMNRLKSKANLPEPIQVISRGFRRNADVVAAVLERANGVCEECGANAPFSRASDGSPYLEVHHRVMLASGGEDTVKNACAVCPNCHRRLRFGV